MISPTHTQNIKGIKLGKENIKDPYAQKTTYIKSKIIYRQTNVLNK